MPYLHPDLFPKHLYICNNIMAIKHRLFLYFLLLWLIGYRPLPTVPRGPHADTYLIFTVGVPPPTPETSLALFLACMHNYFIHCWGTAPYPQYPEVSRHLPYIHCWGTAPTPDASLTLFPDMQLLHALLARIAHWGIVYR